jgi:tetratricopeptide (TPR) repeat protein
MIVDPRRDHSFKVPRPDLSVKLATPNACTTCHNDKSAKWAADHVSDWYPQGRSGTAHYAELFSRARRQSPNERDRKALVELALNQQQPAIVRATSLSHLQENSDQADIEKVIPLLGAEEAMIRSATTRLFRNAPEQQRFQQLMPMLNDSVKSVRTQAVRELLNMPPDRFSQSDKQLVAKIMGEYQASLLATADFPQTQMALGGLAMATRNFKAAESAFREAVAMDPQLSQAWMIITRIQLAQSRLPAARKTMVEALRQNPDAVPFHRMLASISLQLRQPGVAVTLLKNADRLDPSDVSLKNELAGAQIQAQAFGRAIDKLSEALKLDPDNAISLHLTAYAYLASGDLIKAKEYTLLLRRKHPGFTINERLIPFLQLP